jgi:serralysin
LTPTVHILESRQLLDAGLTSLAAPAALVPATATPAAAAQIAFSANEHLVNITYQGHTWNIARPVVCPWNYQATGQTYWVSPAGNDTGNGSAASPFRTIGAALSRVQPGDIVYIEPGVYTESLTIATSGTAAKPIILSCAPGALGQVVITPPPSWVQANPSGAVITVKSADYVWINGLVIQGPKGTPAAPASEHFGANGITWEGGAGLGCRATNNVVYNNVHCGLKEMHHGGVDVLMEGNLCFGNGTDGLDHGIYAPGNGFIIDGNVCFDNAGWGIQSYPNPVGQLIENNICFGNAVGGIVFGGSNGWILNNTVAYNGSMGILYYSGTCTNNVVENNVFAFNPQNAVYGNGGALEGAPSNNTTDYNCYYGGTYSPELQLGPHCRFVDPQFVNAAAGNFRLAATSPLLQAGLKLSGSATAQAPALGFTHSVMPFAGDQAAFQALFGLSWKFNG